MRIRLLERQKGYEEISEAWNALVLQHGPGITGFDVTATYEWAMTLWATHLASQNEQIAVIEEGSLVKGVIPLYRLQKPFRSLTCAQIAPISEIYSQRSGFVLAQADDAAKVFRAAMEFILNELPPWDLFEFTIVDGSTADLLFKRYIQEKSLPYELIGREKCPYMELQNSWEKFLGTLSSKFRGNLRSYEKKMRGAGELRYKTYKCPSQSEEFLAAMLEIERDSWKEAAGTAILAHPLQEAFYRRFIEVASLQGWFSGHLLILDEEPIAYIYGLVFNGCFTSMKTSYKSKVHKMGPGHLIRMFALQQLHAEGLALHDFTGLCEDHKLMWANKIYQRSSYRIFSGTPRAFLTRGYGALSALWDK